jgi:hypothetical protein
MEQHLLDFFSILNQERTKKIIELIDMLDIKKLKILLDSIDENGNIKIKIGDNEV